MALTLETIVNWFMGWMNAIVDNVFFFVNPVLLKLFALSLFVICITKTHVKWVKYTIIIVYVLYCILRITEIRDFVITARWDQFIAIVPFFCMVLLPSIAKQTDLGKYLLSYFAMVFYYVIVNAIWLLIHPEDGEIVIMLMYVGFMFVCGQILEYLANRDGK
jgi:hypothetical protein